MGGHHGGLRGGATFAPGIVGQAFNLPENGAHVEIQIGNDDFNFEPTQPMTVEMWAKRTYPDGPLPSGLAIHLLGKRSERSYYQIFYQHPDWGFELFHEAGNYACICEETMQLDPLPFGRWRHLSVTFDGFVFRFYVDGVLKVGPRFSKFQGSNNAPLLIGGSGVSDTFIGFIDEVRIYNRALTEEEVKARYDAGRSGS